MGILDRYAISRSPQSILKSPLRVYSYMIGRTMRNDMSIESLLEDTHKRASIMNEATGIVRIIRKGRQMNSMIARKW